MKIAIGSDHAGYELKETVKGYLLSWQNVELVDVGTHSGDSVDYPDYGADVAKKVSRGLVDRGILVCGSGIGMSIVANRFPGVRAALCTDPETARLSRQHNDSNILVLAGRKTAKTEAKAIITVWMETDFEGGRHQRRLDKIEKLRQGV